MGAGLRRGGLRGLRPSPDRDVSGWITDGVADSTGLTVGLLLPAGFDSYARLFHPAYLGDFEHEVSWATIAAANGRQAHAAMQWPGVSGRQPYGNSGQDGLWDEEPVTGSLPADPADRLLRVLQRHTTSTGCHYAVWDGLADPAVPVGDAVPITSVGRAMVLLHGPLADAATVSVEHEPWETGPHLWWPDDRSWCVATDIDLMSTYIGGSAACVREILDEPGLEVWPVDRGHRLTLDSDGINAAHVDRI